LQDPISKIQLRNYEAGEFIDEKRRIYEETIQLIRTFPWEVQRAGLQVSLTNPSVTLENGNHDFLKVALFYNGKFVIHYFSRHLKLYTKSIGRFEDSYPYVKAFFEQPEFDLQDLKPDNSRIRNKRSHFVTQDFHYTVNPQSIRLFLLKTSGINFSVSLFIIILLAFPHRNAIPVSGVLALIFLMFVAGGGVNLMLFFNYYSHFRDKILIMSKGNSLFQYGYKGEPVSFDKKEIEELITIAGRDYKNPTAGFVIVRIVFKDGGHLDIPNLLVNDAALRNKLDNIPNTWLTRFPWIST
jgi:hypothetical protein